MPFASVSRCRMHGVLIEQVSGLAVACQLSLGAHRAWHRPAAKGPGFLGAAPIWPCCVSHQ